MQYFFAHAGEDHIQVASYGYPSVFSWYIALPLFILCILGLTIMVYKMSGRSKPITSLVLIAALLTSGVSMYTLSPIVSITALIAGMAVTMILALGPLALPPKKHK